MTANMRTLFILILLTAITCGCSSPSKAPSDTLAEQDVFKDRISDYCELTGYAPIRVNGYSLVLGLAGTGSSECDPVRKKFLIQELQAMKARGQLVRYYQKLSAEEIITNKSTSVVMVSGYIPAGAPKGSIFDVKVVPMPYTQTTSLQGGYLMPTDLQIIAADQVTGRALASRAVARAAGPIFVNPFPASDNTNAATANPRQGYILGGGQSRYDRQINLAILKPDYRIAQQLQKRINTRFQLPNSTKVAEATRTKITLTIPERYRDRYPHFIALVMSLYLQDHPGYLDERLQQLNKLSQQPDADMESIALTWEGIGRNALPSLKSIYENVNDPRAYYAANTALDLGEMSAIDTLVRIADTPNHPCRAKAIQSLGQVAGDYQARAALGKLINHSNNRFRLLAYEGLRKTQNDLIKTLPFPAGFDLDIVSSSGPPLVCVWATTTPRIVLFGHDLQVERNVFYESAEKAVTLNARPGDTDLTIIRQMPNTDEFFTVQSPFGVAKLIEKLAAAPLPDDQKKIQGAGLSFSQVVGVLYQLCERKSINASFFLYHLEQDLAGI